MIGKTFIRGLLGITPIVITIALLIWLFQLLEHIFAPIVIAIIGPEYYFTGLGVIIAVILIFLFGLLLNHWLIRYFHTLFEKLMGHIPLVKTLYNSIADLMNFFRADSQNAHNKVVMVQYGEIRCMGLVTRETFENLPAGIGGEEEALVYFPMSYQIGGYTLVLPKKYLQPIDFTVEAGLRFAVTAGFIQGKKGK